MTTMIFINLPVADLARSRAFYEALGYSINEQFSNDDGNCVAASFPGTPWRMLMPRSAPSTR